MKRPAVCLLSFLCTLHVWADDWGAVVVVVLLTAGGGSGRQAVGAEGVRVDAGRRLVPLLTRPHRRAARTLLHAAVNTSNNQNLKWVALSLKLRVFSNV